MNTKGIKFLAVLAVLAMAFAAVAVIASDNQTDAAAPADGIYKDAAGTQAVAEADYTVSTSTTWYVSGTASTGHAIKVKAGATLTINKATEAVSYSLVIANDSEIENAGTLVVKDPVSVKVTKALTNNGSIVINSHAIGALKVEGATTVAKITTSSGKGTIYFTNPANEALTVNGGIVENQIISSEVAPAEYLIVLDTTSYDATFKDNQVTFKGNYCVAVMVKGAYKATVESNKFINNVSTQQLRSIVMIEPGASGEHIAWIAGAKVQVTGNDFSNVIKYQNQYDREPVRLLALTAKIGTTTAADVILDAEGAELGIVSFTNGVTGSNIEFIENIKLKDLGVIDGFTYVKTGVKLTVTDTVRLGGPFTNNGTAQFDGKVEIKDVNYPEPEHDDDGAIINNGALINNGTITNGETSKPTNIIVNTTGVFTNNGTIDNYGIIKVMNVTDGIVGTNGIIGTGAITVKSGGYLYAGYNSTGTMLLKNTIKAANGAFIVAGQEGTNFLVGAGGAIVLGTNSTFKSVNNSALTGSDYTIVGNATLADKAWFELATFLKGTDTVTFGTDDNKNKTATFTITNAMTVPKGAVLNVLDGAYVSADANITVRGTVNLADSSQYTTKFFIPETGDKGTVNIAGEGGSGKEIKPFTPATGVTTIDGNNFPSGTDAIVTGATLSAVTVPTGKVIIIEATPTTNAVMDISADNTELTIDAPTAATYSVNAGGDNKIYLENVTGALTFTKGSIEIDISKWTGGEIKLDDGAVVKIFGTASAGADLKISMKNPGKTAELFIEKDKEVEITFTANKEFNIGEGITFTIDGKLTIKEGTDEYGDLTTNDKVIINGTVDVSDTFNSKKQLDIYGILKAEDMDADDNVYAWGTSDINGVTAWAEFPAGKSLSGKSSNGGSWTYSAGTLTLTDYQGNYNFEYFKQDVVGGINTIVLEGENKVTYSSAITEVGTYLFGMQTTSDVKIETIQDTGSLEIILNMSKTEPSKLSTADVTIIKATNAELDTVSLKITVKGSNAKWEVKDTKAAIVYGITTTGTLKILDSTLSVDNSVFAPGKVSDKKDTPSRNGVIIGINAGDVLTISNSAVSVKTSGVGIVTSNDAFNVDGSSLTVDAKTDALNIGGGAATFKSSSVSIKAENGIVSEGGIEFNGCIESMIKGTTNSFVGTEGQVNGKLTIRSSSVLIDGEALLSAVTITSGSKVTATDLVLNGALGVSQASELEVKDIRISSTESENNGTITVTGNMVVDKGKTFTNKATFNNKGVTGVYGTFTNSTPGVFNNEGTFTVFTQILGTYSGENNTFTIPGDVRSDDSKAKLKSITLNGSPVMNANGTASVKATLAFDMVAGFDVKDDDKFEGTFAVSQIDKSYTLTLSNGTATVVVTYAVDSSKSKTIGDLYTVTVSGNLVDETDSTKVLYLEPNKSDKTIAPNDKFVDGNLFTISTAPAFSLASGSMVNQGTATIFSSAADFIAEGAVYTGSLITEIPAVTINGEFVGDLIANGTGLVTIANEMAGDVYAKGNVTVSGTLDGDVQISLKAPATAKLTVSGKMLGDLIYVSKYKAASTDTTDTESIAVIDVIADMSVATGETAKSFEINLAAATNATTTTAGTPGYFTFGTLQAPADAKYVVLCLEAGMLKVPASTITLPERYTLLVEKDTTFEVTKGAIFNVKNAAMKVSKDATSNFETGTVAVTYGLVSYVMSFAIEDGAYTIYSDVAYALTNCDEGAELTVGSSAEISSNVAVKDGVNIIVNNVTLTFNGYDVDMADTAKFTVSGTGKIIFKASIDNGKPSDKPWEFYSVTANIVYDDNVVSFDGVRFTADSTIVGVAATSTADSKISTTLLYNEGIAAIVEGTGTGSITIANASYKLLKDATSETLVFGTFIINADAVFDAVAINDTFSVVDYEKLEGATVATIKDVKLMPTTVGVEGTLNLLNSTTVKGIYAGLGKITLASGKEFILAKSDKVPTGEESLINKTIPGHVAAKIVDTTDDENGYVLNIVSAKDDATLSFKATTLKIEGETINAMTISGDMGAGIINSTSDAFLNAVTIREDASIFGDDVYIIGASKSEGYLGAVTMHMKEGTAVSDYSTLDYQATIVEDGFTVYTYFDSIDFEEATDVYLATNVTITEKLDVSGKDVNIVIAEGKALTIKNVFIIGTPITVLGDEGSSIVGKVIIDNTVDKAYYLVAYADVDLSDAEIVAKHAAAAKPTDAVVSKLIVEENLYATIFAEEDSVKLSKADAALVPEIVGYNFTAWINYNGAADAKVGETNAYADAKATYVTVIVKYVAGVDYYMNGSLFDALNVYTDVPYGSYFTAKISDTSKYQGNPLVNGEKTVYVIDDMELVASGVTPIPEPTPEPVEENTGLTLTDILLIVLVVLIAIMVVILVLRLNRS